MEHQHLRPKDWDAVAADPAFAQLLRTKRRFVVPATTFFALYYFSLPVLVGAFPALARRPVWGDLTLAYAFAFSQFAMAWVLLALYVWRARAFDALQARVIENVARDLKTP
ncbi:MAG TPA: DUF485 domain-containing protein [Candidatus Baltobacteraceae bacterium]